MQTKFQFIKDGTHNYLKWISSVPNPILKIKTGKKKYLPSEHIIQLDKIVDVMGWKAVGNKIAENDLLEVNFLQSDTLQSELF
ncbi:MAG: DNA topoisomerase [Bacteroidetes bacterium OLB11]|nr:MAG: DNA topoisomerase [Bacteroidetes bacterium OLB11]